MLVLNRTFGAFALVVLLALSAGQANAQYDYSLDYQTNTINVASNWVGNGTYVVGSNTFLNALEINSGGALSNGTGYIGYAGSDNAAIINGGIWSNGFDLYVGNFGAGNSLTISNGGAVFNNSGILGNAGTSSNNVVVVTGAGSVWSNRSNLYVGSSGAGNSLTISNGGAVFNDTGYLGAGGSTSNNVTTVSGNNAKWVNRGSLSVGDSGDSNTLNIGTGGSVLASNVYVGFNTGANGNKINVTGGMLYVTNGVVTVGAGNNNSVSVSKGGLLQAGSLTIAGGTGNVVTVNGGTLQLNSTTSFGLFSGATTIRNSLIVSNGGKLITTSTSFIRYSTSGSYSNSITVTGSGSVWSNTAQMFDSGGPGGDRITVAKGGSMVTTGLEFDVGFFAPDERLTVTDAGSSARVEGNLNIGQSTASNAVIISSGGKLVRTAGTGLTIGAAAGGDRNSMTVSGSGSVLSNMSGALNVGYIAAKSNSLLISQGGKVYNNGDLVIGNSSGAFGNGVTVTGSGSLLTNTGNLVVGNFLLVPTYNFLTVSNGGTAFFANVYVGGSAANNALNSLLTVTGPSSFLQVVPGGDLHLGGGAAGGNDNSVLVNDGGVLEANSLTIQAGSTGNTISNRSAIYQFTAGTPTISPNSGIIAVTNGTISFRAATDANVWGSLGGAKANSLTNIQYAGNNTFRLNAASNTTSVALDQTYTFQTGTSSNFSRLEMVNGQTAYRNGNITVGTTGTMLVSNTTATITGLFTNTGSLSFVNARATFQSRVNNSGTNRFLKSVGTFNGGAVNAGVWMTDPTTNVFTSFGLTNEASGVITMTAGDVFVFSNTQAGTASSFVNISTNAAANDTRTGTMVFRGGLSLTQSFTVAGKDLGPAPGTPVLTATNQVLGSSGSPGFTANFSLGTLEISNFSTVRVSDAFLGMPGLGSNDFLTAGLYLNKLFLGANSLLIIDTNVQVYFRQSNNWTMANIRLLNNQSSLYLGDAGNYNNNINGLHQLIVVPEPNVVLLWLAGAGTAITARRRHRRQTRAQLVKIQPASTRLRKRIIVRRRVERPLFADSWQTLRAIGQKFFWTDPHNTVRVRPVDSPKRRRRKRTK